MEQEAALRTLKGEVERTPHPTEARASWILEEAWWISDIWEALQRTAWASAREVIKARKDFQNFLQANIKRRVKKAGEEVEAIMVSDQYKEAWDCI